jgi:hypothetical protein
VLLVREQRLVAHPLPVHPGVAFPHHFAVDVAVAVDEVADAAAVAVVELRLHLHDVAGDLLDQRLLRAPAPGLPVLGRIDLGEAHLHLRAVDEQRDRVAVGDVHDLPRQGLGGGD